jgi:hypothetical protein
MEQSLSLEASSHSPSQEYICLPWYSKSITLFAGACPGSVQSKPSHLNSLKCVSTSCLLTIYLRYINTASVNFSGGAWLLLQHSTAFIRLVSITICFPLKQPSSGVFYVVGYFLYHLAIEVAPTVN